MIAVAHEKSSLELLPQIVKLGVKAYKDYLPFGDFCFEGSGPEGVCLVGIERKKLGDMLNCIEDGRYSGHQQPGMMKMYRFRVLIIEGIWKPDESGILMQAIRDGWAPVKPTGYKVMYHKLFRYLLSAQFIGGAAVVRSGSPYETAFQIVECYHYFQKAWDKHTSMQQFHHPALPQFTEPSPLRRMAATITGIGIKYSAEADRIFKGSIPAMINATEVDWMKIPGIGVKTARQIVKEIWNL